MMTIMSLHKMAGYSEVIPAEKESKTLGDRSQFAKIVIILLIASYCIIAFTSLHIGAAAVSATGVFFAVLGFDVSQFETLARDTIIILDIRLPRLALGSLIGAALAVSGVTLQALFRNPLADPGIIGVSAGASLGAVSMIVIGGTWLGSITAIFGTFSLPVMSFFGALLVTLLLQKVSTKNGHTSIVTMLLAGIALQAFASALTGILIFLADDQQLRDLTFWGLGSLAGATWLKVLSAGPIMIFMLCVVPFLSRSLNALALGEATAYHLGIAVQKLKITAIVIVAAMTGAAVAVSGGIGFIGIVVPHLLRLVIGPDNRFLMPACALLGASLLILADMIARTIVAPAELPIGIVTALAGSPFFLWLLIRRKGILET